MTKYYLDIETTGLDEVNNKIISIQYIKMSKTTGQMIGTPTILKEWELGEKEMICKFIENTDILSPSPFDFIPVGYNLGFEHKFLLSKSSKYVDFPINVFSRPHIDVHSIGILMNCGEFRGSGLDRITQKQNDGKNIPTLYAMKRFDEIEKYIQNETESFLNFFEWLQKELPQLRDKWVYENKGDDDGYKGM